MEDQGATLFGLFRVPGPKGPGDPVQGGAGPKLRRQNLILPEAQLASNCSTDLSGTRIASQNRSDHGGHRASVGLLFFLPMIWSLN